MKYLTEPLYKKMQLFHLPLEAGMSLTDLEEEFGIELQMISGGNSSSIYLIDKG